MSMASTLIPLGVEYPFFVYPFIRMGAKIVTLSLNQVGRQPGAAVTIKVSQRCHESGRGNSRFHGDSRYMTQVFLPLNDYFARAWDPT